MGRKGKKKTEKKQGRKRKKSRSIRKNARLVRLYIRIGEEIVAFPYIFCIHGAVMFVVCLVLAHKLNLSIDNKRTETCKGKQEWMSTGHDNQNRQVTSKYPGVGE